MYARVCIVFTCVWKSCNALHLNVVVCYTYDVRVVCVCACYGVVVCHGLLLCAEFVPAGRWGVMYAIVCN